MQFGDGRGNGLVHLLGGRRGFDVVLHGEFELVRLDLGQGHLHGEEGDDGEEEEQTERCHVAGAPPGDIFRGQVAGADIQVPQRAEDARIDIEDNVGKIGHDLGQVPDHALLGLAAGVAIRPMRRRAAIRAGAQRRVRQGHREFRVSRRLRRQRRWRWRQFDIRAHRGLSIPWSRRQLQVSCSGSSSSVIRWPGSTRR